MSSRRGACAHNAVRYDGDDDNDQDVETNFISFGLPLPGRYTTYIYIYTAYSYPAPRTGEGFCEPPGQTCPHHRQPASRQLRGESGARARACQPVPACAPCANFVFAHASARIIFARLAYNFERHKVRRPCGDVGNNHVGLLAVQKINISSQCACAGTHARLRRDDEVLRPHRYDRKDGVAWAKSRLGSIHAIYIYMMCVGAPAHEWAE